MRVNICYIAAVGITNIDILYSPFIGNFYPMSNQSSTTPNKHLTLSDLQRMKDKGEKITCLTVYDASYSRLLSDAGVDVLLIGDSLGMTIGGHKTTVPVKMEQMIYHTENVVRANPNGLIMTDMPFMSYTNTQQAMQNATLLMQAGAEVVKMEGDAWLLPIVTQLAEKGIPTCVHLGLTPQSVHSFGGYKVQGRNPDRAEQLLAASMQLEQAGARLLVLECIPYPLAQKITQAVKIPTIGIGAGPYCDGQVLVLYDMLGLSPGKPLTFVQDFLTGQKEGTQGAIRDYIRAVKDGKFPTLEQSFV